MGSNSVVVLHITTLQYNGSFQWTETWWANTRQLVSFSIFFTVNKICNLLCAPLGCELGTQMPKWPKVYYIQGQAAGQTNILVCLLLLSDQTVLPQPLWSFTLPFNNLYLVLICFLLFNLYIPRFLLLTLNAKHLSKLQRSSSDFTKCSDNTLSIGFREERTGIQNGFLVFTFCTFKRKFTVTPRSQIFLI